MLAFLLNYPVSWMEHHGARREQVAILVFLLALSILLALGVTLFPLALTQAQQLVARLPELIDSGRSQLMILNEARVNRLWTLSVNDIKRKSRDFWLTD